MKMLLSRSFTSFVAIFFAASSYAQTPSDRLNLIQKQGLLKVCVQDDYYGISYLNPKTQKLEGLDVDMAKELAKELAVKVRFLISSSTKVADDLRQNRCDVAMFALVISQELSKKLRFTKPVMVTDVYGVTTHFNRRIKSWNDVDTPGSVIAVLRGSLHERLLRKNLSMALIEAHDSLLASEYEVESNRADLLVTDYQNSSRLINSKDWVRLVKPDNIFHRSVHAYASHPNDEPWGELLDKFVKEIKRDGRLLNKARYYSLESLVVTR